MSLENEIKELRLLAQGDAEKSAQHKIDLNPFSTTGGRTLWQRGWDGVRPDLLTDQSGDWRKWERGRQARILCEERIQQPTTTPPNV